MALPWLAAPAWAQEGLDAHGLTLAAHELDIRDPLMLERPDGNQTGDWWVSALGEYANAPLVLETSDGRTPLLNHVVATNLSTGVAVQDWLRVNLAMPVFLFGTNSGTPTGAHLGDLTVSAMGSLQFADGDRMLGVGFIPNLVVPSGDATRQLGRPGWSGGGVLAVTGEMGPLTAGANAGLQFEPGTTWLNADGGDRVITGLHVGWVTQEQTGVNLEWRQQMSLASKGLFGTNGPGEVAVSVRQRAFEGPWYTVGAATAVTQGIGAAAFRVFVGGGWGDNGRPGFDDTDRDGLADRKDACPEMAETDNGHRDDDGCPDELPMVSLQVMLDGEPAPEAEVLLSVEGAEEVALTWTGESLVQESLPGVMHTATAMLGPCLSGEGSVMSGDESATLTVDLAPVLQNAVTITVTNSEGEPVADASVKLTGDDPHCGPAQTVKTDADGNASAQVGPGIHTAKVSASGFESAEVTAEVVEGADEVALTATLKAVETPSVPLEHMEVKDDHIALTSRIDFSYESDALLIEAVPVLDELAFVLLSRSDLDAVEIAGHTDNQGDPEALKRLSEMRAEAVVAALVERGVPAERLTARGYGADEPVAPNRTPMGRAQNRRIEVVFAADE